MKRSELKKIIKPLVLECINEVLLSEQGMLSNKHRKSLMDSLGKDSYGGINLFEGIEPAPAQRKPEHSAANPIGNVAPGDPGVDISGILALGGANWKELIK